MVDIGCCFGMENSVVLGYCVYGFFFVILLAENYKH